MKKILLLFLIVLSIGMVSAKGAGTYYGGNINLIRIGD